MFHGALQPQARLSYGSFVLHVLHLSAAVVAVAPSKAGAKGPAELVLVPGESELHKARRSHGCCFRAEVSCMVSSAAVS